MEIIKTHLEEKEQATSLINKTKEYWKVVYGEFEYGTALEMITNTLAVVRKKISENEGQEQSYYRALELFMESNIKEFPDRKREITALGIIATDTLEGLTDNLANLANKELQGYETDIPEPLPENQWVTNTPIEGEKK